MERRFRSGSTLTTQPLPEGTRRLRPYRSAELPKTIWLSPAIDVATTDERPETAYAPQPATQSDPLFPPQLQGPLSEAVRPGEFLVTPMPKMRTQLFKPGLSGLLTLGISDLNCGYYVTKAILHYWAQRLHPAGHDQSVPLERRRRMLGMAYAPVDSPNPVISQAFSAMNGGGLPLATWKLVLLANGPVMAEGNFALQALLRGLGFSAGLAHVLLVVGVDGAEATEPPTRVAIKDPLHLRDRVRWMNYTDFQRGLEQLVCLDEQSARRLLRELNPDIVLKAAKAYAAQS